MQKERVLTEREHGRDPENTHREEKRRNGSAATYGHWQDFGWSSRMDSLYQFVPTHSLSNIYLVRLCERHCTKWWGCGKNDRVPAVR